MPEKNIPLAQPLVKRQVSEPQTHTETQVPSEIEDLGLPFYYYNKNWSIFMIVAGVILLLWKLFCPLLFLILPHKQKKYMCVKCHREFYREGRNPKICDICGGRVVECKE